MGRSVSVNKKRLNIGLLVGKITDYFSSELSKGAIETAKQLDVNLTVIPGGYLGIQDYNDSLGNFYEYQSNVLYNYAAKAAFEYLIVCTGTICYALDKEKSEKFLDTFGDTPLLSVAYVSEKHESLVFDNRSGIADAIDYLAKQGRKHIGIMAGMPDNYDCLKRIEAYKEGLERNGLEFKESYVQHCDIAFESGSECDEFLDNNPEIDAVLCVNDIIASIMYNCIVDREKRVGSDIAVIGFDDRASSKDLDPPLASVKADAKLLGKRSVEIAVARLTGKKTEIVPVPTSFVPRHSCFTEDASFEMPADLFEGTMDQVKENLKAYLDTVIFDLSERKKINDSLSDFVDFLDAEFIDKKADRSSVENTFARVSRLYATQVGGLSRMANLLEVLFIWLMRNADAANVPAVKELFDSLKTIRETDIHKGQNLHEFYSRLENGFIRDSLNVGVNLKDSYGDILRKLCNIGSVTSYLYVLDKPVIHNNGFEYPQDYSWQFKAYCYGAHPYIIRDKDKDMDTPQVFSNVFLVSDRPRILIATVLYTAATQYGLALLEPEGWELFDELTLITNQLSSACRTLDILRSLNDHLIDINDRNTELETESKTDELTRVYNRKGFFKACDELIEKYAGKDDEFVICYADTDDLREINIEHGHIEGDYSIKLTSDCLRHAFGRYAVIGRMGGGEFAVITHHSQIFSPEDVMGRKEKFLENLNASSIKPYKFRISMGITQEHCTNRADVEDALEKACELILDRRKK